MKDLIDLKDKIKLIISDIDGTLLDSKHSMPQVTLDTIREFKSKYPNVPIILATGKTLFGAKPVLESFNVKTGIFLNGALILRQDPECVDSQVPGYRVVYEKHLEPEAVNWLFEMNQQLDLCAVFYSFDTIYTFHTPAKDHWKYIVGLTRFHEPLAVPVEDIPDFKANVQQGSRRIQKFILMADPSRIDALKIQIENLPGFPKGMQLVKTQPEMLEAMPIDMNKSSAIQAFCRNESVKLDNVLAFGDGMNDLEMLRDVGFGVRMGNCVKELERVTKYSTSSSDQAGVAHFLSRIYDI